MSFDLQPTLEGELLQLRPLRVEHFDELYTVASDPLIWEQHPNSDRYKREVFQAFFQDALESRGALIALDTKDDKVIGSSRFYGFDSQNSEIEIGWTFLARSHWGRLFNREMKRLMLKHAFRFVENVIFRIGPKNLRSRRAVEKVGGILIAPRQAPGGHECVVYRITASEFAEGSLMLSGTATADDVAAPQKLTPEEQMALYEKELKENDWCHQPC